MADTEWSSELIDAPTRKSHVIDLKMFDKVIVFDDGDTMYCNIKKGGWLRDTDGDAHRIRKLGFEELVIPASRTNDATCDRCGRVCKNKLGLSKHRKWCRRPEELTFQQQQQRRKCINRHRTSNAIEKVTVTDASNYQLAGVSKFQYLGTIVRSDASLEEELNTRMGRAWNVVIRLSKFGKSKTISRKTKSCVFRATVLSVLLYNSEVWPLKKHHLSQLERWLTRAAKKVINAKYDEHLGRSDILDRAYLNSIEEIIRAKRIRWVAHAMRRPATDRSRQQVNQQIQNKSLWGKLVLDDFDGENIELISQNKKELQNWLFVEGRCRLWRNE
jgi:hypothetical protein